MATLIVVTGIVGPALVSEHDHSGVGGGGWNRGLPLSWGAGPEDSLP